MYASVFGAHILRYSVPVALLVPLEDTVFGIGGASCPIRFWMVVRGLLIPLLWKDQENWGFGYVVDVVDDHGFYLTIIVFNILFNSTLYADFITPS